MKKYLTGLTTTNELTLGNYIGAILPLKKFLNEEDEIYLFAADLHAISQGTNSSELQKNIKNLICIFLASGFDRENVKIYVQSKIMGHGELAYLFTSVVPIGDLERMTQFKDKAQSYKLKNKTISIPSGIFFYPLLMAADILLYNPDYVIVGQDQKQHIEITQRIAEKMNSKYKTNFKIPKAMISKENAKIMSLKDPLKKMSKSDKNKDATIFLLDDEKTVINKITKAVTDSENKVYYDSKNKPGVSNLLNIYATLNNLNIEEAEQKLKNLNYKDFKIEVANSINKTLKTIQTKYNRFINVDIEKLLKNDKVQIEAINNLKNIKIKMGL